VVTCWTAGSWEGRIRVDHSSRLHMELPAGVEWTEPDTSAAKHDLIAGTEGEG
jgi:hypothetical protein